MCLAPIRAFTILLIVTVYRHLVGMRMCSIIETGFGAIRNPNQARSPYRPDHFPKALKSSRRVNFAPLADGYCQAWVHNSNAFLTKPALYAALVCSLLSPGSRYWLSIVIVPSNCGRQHGCGYGTPAASSLLAQGTALWN